VPAAAERRAAIDRYRYLRLSGPTAANPQQRSAAANGTDRQTDVVPLHGPCSAYRRHCQQFTPPDATKSFVAQSSVNWALRNAVHASVHSIRAATETPEFQSFPISACCAYVTRNVKNSPGLKYCSRGLSSLKRCIQRQSKNLVFIREAMLARFQLRLCVCLSVLSSQVEVRRNGRTDRARF